MSSTPKTVKAWSAEITQALDEAKLLLKETENEIGKNLIDRLFISAPVIAMKNRNIDFSKNPKAMNYACESVVSMLNEYPELQKQSDRCFAHAYVDTHIYLKLYKQSKCENLFCYLERKNIIES
jgi:5-bromo-4-chloroindolyl phosphate hydrolysis protein